MTWMLLAAMLGAESAPPAAPAAASDSPRLDLRAPLFDAAFARTPVASVDGEPVLVKELTAILEEAHAEAGAGGAKTAKQDVMRVVERLVTIRIVAAEAKAMGMDELPELAKALSNQRGIVSRAIVKDRFTRSVAFDPAQVEEILKGRTREVRLDSVTFKVPEEAEAFRKAVAAGGDWKKLADEAIQGLRATSGDLPDFVKPEKLLPGVREVVAGLSRGEVAKTPVITSRGAAVIRLADERFPEDPEERARAEEASRGARAQVELGKFYGDLARRYATVNRQLLRQLDLDSKKKFAAAEKDRRALATIRGAAPLRVSDLAAAVRSQFFHGADRRAEKKGLNAMKQPFFDDLLFKRLLDREAEVQKVAESEEFKEQYGDFERSQLFAKFVERVLIPGVDVKESEAKARYDADLARWRTPAMLRLEALAFADPAGARAALEKGQRGAEFRWLAENAEHQVPAEARNLEVTGKPVSLAGLPAGVARSLANAHEGDYRLHVEESQHWLFHVAGEIPAAVRPYEEARTEVVNVLFGERLDAALRDYVAKLRATHRIEIYATGIAS